ncbi:hypothetical protein BRARA_C01831 [Brassica rapa]|uniref:DUF4378 domain-containing protein n=1 Tax=Brassica campestris TaxID=3711 RepID=A0A397ZX80_BRACM|nr:hypothetical protein BRARA_C01831 [Brassica rapa]CAG7880658.1 unnamed protein product [Brassica rapa]VDC80046.1 unnamed protein product [Brassica rapa]
MAAEKKKHLRELLEDDQEPFHLNHYIADLRSQMGYSDLRVKKLKPQNAAVLPPGLFTCGESSCFLATHHTNKSPLFELRSPSKNESSDGQVFLRIPARTAAILLEAATRIQKQQSEKANKTNNRGNAFGLFGSVLKRLTNRKAKPRSDNADKCFCESPFHFVLHATPSTSSQQTPQFTSTATSPARRSTEDEDSDETESLEKVRGQDEEDKEEEDKEQCSPVSVLDPLEKEEDHHQREVPDHLNLLSCSFEVVQRTKRRRLLKKLCRFEKLAGMDPVDLEGKMSEEQEEENEESVEDNNMRVYDLAEEYEDMDEAMARESGWVEEERTKKWRMMNAWRLGMGAEEAAEAVVQKDIRGEAGEWTRHGGEVEEAVSEIELSIFIFLIDEFSHELVSSFMNE